MPTTAIDFLHLRTTAGLARQVKRIAFRNRWFTNNQKKIEESVKALEKAFEQSLIDDVQETLDALFETLSREEKDLFTVETDELILLREEQKDIDRAKVLNDRLKKVMANDSTDDEQLRRFKQELGYKLKADEESLKDVMAEIYAEADKIRRMLYNLEADNILRIEGTQLGNLIKTRRKMQKDVQTRAKMEVKEVQMDDYLLKTAEKESFQLEKIHGKLHAIAGNNKLKHDTGSKAAQEFNAVMKHLLDEEKIVLDNLRKEGRAILDIIKLETLLYAKLFKVLLVELGNLLKRMAQEGYPAHRLDEIMKKYRQTLNFMYDRIKKIYGMGRYDQRVKL